MLIAIIALGIWFVLSVFGIMFYRDEANNYHDRFAESVQRERDKQSEIVSLRKKVELVLSDNDEYEKTIECLRESIEHKDEQFYATDLEHQDLKRDFSRLKEENANLKTQCGLIEKLRHNILKLSSEAQADSASARKEIQRGVEVAAGLTIERDKAISTLSAVEAKLLPLHREVESLRQKQLNKDNMLATVREIHAITTEALELL